jgi:hypothetical protein
MWAREAELRQKVRLIEPSAARKCAASRSQNYSRDLLGMGHFGNLALDAYRWPWRQFLTIGMARRTVIQY